MLLAARVADPDVAWTGSGSCPPENGLGFYPPEFPTRICPPKKSDPESNYSKLFCSLFFFLKLLNKANILIILQFNKHFSRRNYFLLNMKKKNIFVTGSNLFLKDPDPRYPGPTGSGSATLMAAAQQKLPKIMLLLAIFCSPEVS